MLLDRFNEWLVAGQGFECTREQDALHIHADGAAAARWVEAGRSVGDGAAQRRLHLDRVFLGDHSPVDLEQHLAGDHVGVGATADLAHVEVGVGDALNAGRDLQVVGIELVERIEDVRCALQCVGAAVWNGSVRHVAVHHHLQLQAAVVRHHHLVAEAGSDHEVGFCQALFQQPVGADFATEFFVVGHVQLHAPGELRVQRFERADGEGEAGDVALAHRCGAAVNFAVDDLAAVGINCPAVARWHHVAVRVERDRFAGAIGPAHDQVGDALQAGGLYLGGGHCMFLRVQAHGCEQLGGALGVRRVVAGWCVGGHTHECLQKAHLFVEMGVDPGVELLFCGHGFNVGVHRPIRWPIRRPVGRAGARRRSRTTRCRRWWRIPAGCG